MTSCSARFIAAGPGVSAARTEKLTDPSDAAEASCSTTVSLPSARGFMESRNRSHTPERRPNTPSREGKVRKMTRAHRSTVILVATALAMLGVTAGIAGARTTVPTCVSYNGQVFNVLRAHTVNTDDSYAVRVSPIMESGMKVPGGWLIAGQVSGKKAYGWGVWAITDKTSTTGGRVYSVNAVARAHTNFRKWTRTLPVGASVRAITCAKGQ